MEFNKDRLGGSIFWDHTFFQAEFAYNNKTHGLIRFSRTLKRIDFVEISDKIYKTTTDKKWQEELFEEEDMKIVYLGSERISIKRVPTI